MPATDLTYTALFSVNQYTIQFVADGELIKEETLDYGTPIDAPEAPAKEEYTFQYWEGLDATVPAHDAVYEAYYTLDRIVVKVDENNFPDANFRRWLLSQEYGQDGEIDEDELAVITSVDVSGQEISNMSGIEYFTSLTSLNCSQNNISAAYMRDLITRLPYVNNGVLYVMSDEEENNSIEMTQVVAAQNKGWTPVYYDGGKWNEFEYIEIAYYTFPDNAFRSWILNQSYGADGLLTKDEIANVKSINVNNCGITSLKGIEIFTALTNLDCRGNQLTQLDITKNTALEKLTCYDNKLTELNISQNTALKFLYCKNNLLQTLDLSRNRKLVEVHFHHNQISGANMDAMIQSLPKSNNRILYAIYDKDEENAMTASQVNAAKAKGWITYCYENGSWKVYSGIEEVEPEVITEETTVNVAAEAEAGNATVTDDGVIISLDDEDVVDVIDGSITMKTAQTPEGVEQIAAEAEPGTKEFTDLFKGICFMLGKGKGHIDIDCQTFGNYQLTVKIGASSQSYTSNNQGVVSIDYDLTNDQWVFIFPSIVSSVKAYGADNSNGSEGGLKIYSVKIVPDNTSTSISAIDVNGEVVDVYSISGVLVVKNATLNDIKQLSRGIYVINGQKVLIK